MQGQYLENIRSAIPIVTRVRTSAGFSPLRITTIPSTIKSGQSIEESGDQVEAKRSDHGLAKKSVKGSEISSLPSIKFSCTELLNKET